MFPVLTALLGLLLRLAKIGCGSWSFFFFALCQWTIIWLNEYSFSLDLFLFTSLYLCLRDCVCLPLSLCDALTFSFNRPDFSRFSVLVFECFLFFLVPAGEFYSTVVLFLHVHAIPEETSIARISVFRPNAEKDKLVTHSRL